MVAFLRLLAPAQPKPSNAPPGALRRPFESPSVADADPMSLAELDDDGLIARCLREDRAALTELYKRHRAQALRFIRHAARNSQDVDDILQEVFVEVARSLRHYEGRAAFSTWLHRICVRTAVRFVKRRHRQVGEPEPEGPRADPADPGMGPHEGTETAERQRRIARLVEQLAPKKRTVLVLHDLEGVPAQRIAELVGAPVLTVRTRLFYARKELAALAVQDPMLAEFFDDGLDGPVDAGAQEGGGHASR